MTTELCHLGLDTLPDPEPLLAQVCGDRAMGAVNTLAQWQRLSGSADERQAFTWLAGELEQLGLSVTLLTHDAYISIPGSARLSVLEPVMQDIPCITVSFSTSVADLRAQLSRHGEQAGKVVLEQGLPNGASVREAELSGASAVIFWWDNHLHEGQVSPLWGSPTAENESLLPKVPVLNIRRADAAWLHELLRDGEVVVRLQTDVSTSWRPIPLLIAEQAGREEPERVVLLSGHVDSWYHGAMDNASANAAMLEVARLLSRTGTRRTVRYAWWSGHSHGRYAGSAWYAAAHRSELAERVCVHINFDSLGGRGASVLTEAPTMAETFQVGRECIAAVTGQNLRRRNMTRFADQSFLDIGVPSIFATLSEQPFSPDTPTVGVQRRLPPDDGGGTGWWWHTDKDTPDKVDPAYLVRDTQVYTLCAWRYANQPIIPLDYTAVAEEWMETAPPDLQVYLEEFAKAWAEAAALAVAAYQRDAEAATTINSWLMRLSRLLVPPRFSPHFGADVDAGTPRAEAALRAATELCRSMRVHFQMYWRGDDRQ